MIPKSSPISAILNLASRMETDGIKFYGEAASRTKSAMGRLMYTSLARDEQNHLRILNDIVRGMFNESLDQALTGNPATRLRSVFEQNKGILDQRVAAGADDLRALETALKIEDESWRLYKDGVARALGKEEKALLDRLAEEEKRHYKILENARTFLADTGNWFIYAEHTTMDGG